MDYNRDRHRTPDRRQATEFRHAINPGARLRDSSYLLLVAGVRVIAQDRSRSRPGHDEPEKVRNYRETAISPDGKRVAWVEGFDGAGEPSSGHSGIFVADLASGGGMPRRITAGDGKAGCAEHSIAWSPDGGRLAFLSDHDKAGQLQVYVARRWTAERRGA